MIPYLLSILGGFLVGKSLQEKPKSYSTGGDVSDSISFNNIKVGDEILIRFKRFDTIYVYISGEFRQKTVPKIYKKGDVETVYVENISDDRRVITARFIDGSFFYIPVNSNEIEIVQKLNK